MKGVGKFGEVMAGEHTQATYDEALERLRKVARSGSQRKAILDFTCKELRRMFPHFTWVGVYRVEGDALVLHGWAGPAATVHTRIPIGQGICGLAARTGTTVNVPDVHADARYLECFVSTNAEIVVPIARDGTVVGEIDVDSDERDAFDTRDAALLEALATELAPVL